LFLSLGSFARIFEFLEIPRQVREDFGVTLLEGLLFLLLTLIKHGAQVLSTLPIKRRQILLERGRLLRLRIGIKALMVGHLRLILLLHRTVAPAIITLIRDLTLD